MAKQIIRTDNAPKPIGPYTQAVKTGDLLFISGQIAIDPVSNELIQGTISEETKQVMENLKAVLHAAYLTFEHVVKATIFLSDMNLFAEVNEVYGSYFSGDYPARETVAVAGLPKHVNVEISMVAVLTI